MTITRREQLGKSLSIDRGKEFCNRFHNIRRMATLRDVAISAGLSPATASRALSGARYVDAATRTRVMTAARDLGYRPNALARALRAKQTMTIGLIVPDIRNDFYAETATVLQRAFEERGYRLLVVHQQQRSRERSLLSAHADRISRRRDRLRTVNAGRCARRARGTQTHSDRRALAPYATKACSTRSSPTTAKARSR